ncbi:MAG: glutathione S-transferase family protein [Nannocystaceae bacterium]
MHYVIHGAPGSGSGIVEAACAEIGAPYELRDLDARHDEHRGQAYASLNPQRKMPTLEVDDGETITESVAIVLTLDERHRDAGLLPPPGSKARAQALRWMVFMAAELYPLVEIIDYPERFAPGPEHVDAMRGRATELWRQRWQVLEGNLAGTPYCSDDGFSATDLYATVLGRWVDPSWRREHLPKVEAVMEAVRARPGLASVWARHFPS